MSDERMTVVRDVLVPDAVAGSSVALSGERQGDCIRGDLILRDGRAVLLRPGRKTPGLRIVLPALTEAHCHLDKCHTIDRLDGFAGGDLRDAIAAQVMDKANWTEDDLRARIGQGLAELQKAGCALIRSHVDWGDGVAPPLAWQVMADCAADLDGVTLDRAALVNAARIADPDHARALGTRLQADDGTLGTFVLDQPERSDAIRAAFETADRFGLRLDFHVDESLAPGLDGLETIARTARDMRFQGPVLCGHSVSLMNATGDRLSALLDLIAESGIAIAALPTTNLYLQGRTDGTPDRRGISRLRELRAAGVPVVVGSDNVADAFCPTGAHDPMAALGLAVLGAHLDPPFGRWITAITTDAARALGRTPVHVIGAPAQVLRLSRANSLSTLLSGRAGPPEPLTDHLEVFTE